MNHFFYISKQGETEDGRNSIVYYRLKEFTLGKMYISVYETWKEKQFSLNCHVLNVFFKISSQTDTTCRYTEKLLFVVVVIHHLP